MNRKRETASEREHRHDREVSAATYRVQTAREGRGFKFELPPSLRETKA